MHYESFENRYYCSLSGGTANGNCVSSNNTGGKIKSTSDPINTYWFDDWGVYVVQAKKEGYIESVTTVEVNHWVH